MKAKNRLRIAIQKSGRLAEKSIHLFQKCGLDFEFDRDRLFHHCNHFPIDLMMVRDDDIPEYIKDGICDLGVVGENLLNEMDVLNPVPHQNGQQKNGQQNGNAQHNSTGVQVLVQLGFGKCRLSLAVPEAFDFKSVQDLQGLRIATSYPRSLSKILKQYGVQAKIVQLGGSVEIAPQVGIADAVCDLVSTGATLRSNGLKEVKSLWDSQAVLIQTGAIAQDSAKSYDVLRLLQRLKGVLKADQSKYIMMNAPRESIASICRMIPGLEEPSILPVGTDGKRVALHAVAREAVFWETMENLKAAGASSILVLPIEKVID
jgi:ATP phosphoribosyltransferase